jgi:hypothetical protein
MSRCRALILPMLMLLILAACGGPAASGDGNGNGDGSSDGGEASQSEASQPSAEASTGGNGHSAGDLDSLIEALTPPNATEISRTTAGGGAFIAWESTDSVDSLKSFYESAIPDAGMTIFSTTSASGSHAWVFAENEGSSFGGSVTVGPSSSGGDGASVVIGVSTE